VATQEGIGEGDSAGAGGGAGAGAGAAWWVGGAGGVGGGDAGGSAGFATGAGAGAAAGVTAVAGAGAAGAGGGAGAPWCGGAEAGRLAIGVNSPGFHVWGMRRTEGSFRKRSAWPHDRQIRVPSDSSPRERSESDPPPIPPVLRSFAQTKSDAPQLLHTGANRVTLRSA
jgi:hypothetical protein